MTDKTSLISDLKKEFSEHLQTKAPGSAQSTLNTLWDIYEEDAPGNKKEQLAVTLAESFSSIGEHYEETLDIFSLLDCVNGCRDLLGDFPENEECAFYFLESMTGLLYVKIMMREDGMVKEFGDEIFKIANRFPENEKVCSQACGGLVNLIPLCGGFDAPLSLAYNAADKVAVLSKLHPTSEAVQTALGHALISVCAIARRTDNLDAFYKFAEQLMQFLEEKNGVFNTAEIDAHFNEAMFI